MLEARDLGVPRKDMLPDMFGLYAGHSIDEYLLDHHTAIYAINDEPQDTDEAEHEHLVELTRQRHKALQVKPEDYYSGLSESDELMLKLWDIENVWTAYYLEPRMAPLKSEPYGDWLAHCLGSRQDVILQYTRPKSDYGSIALTDLRLPPLYANGRSILVPPTVSVEAPFGLVTSRLMTWSAETPLVVDTPIAVCITGDMARRLMFESGLNDERIIDIATKEAA